MPRLYSSRHIVKVLEQQGFNFVSQKGSHLKYRKQTSGKMLTAIVPADRKEIPAGTFSSILRQSNLTKSDFE